MSESKDPKKPTPEEGALPIESHVQVPDDPQEDEMPEILPIDDSAVQSIGFQGKIQGTMTLPGGIRRPYLKIHSSVHPFPRHDIPALTIKDSSLNVRNASTLVGTTIYFRGAIETHGGTLMYVAHDVSTDPLNANPTH